MADPARILTLARENAGRAAEETSPGENQERSGLIKALELARRARGVLTDRKGIDIRLFDVRKISGIADYMLVVSGMSPPHLKAMSGEVHRALKDDGVHCYRKAGVPECGWMVLDYVDVVIHIFSPAARRHYAVEELWALARKVE
jgi:ribosome-associated protein